MLASYLWKQRLKKILKSQQEGQGHPGEPYLPVFD